MNNFTSYPPSYTPSPTVQAVKHSAGSVTFLLTAVTYTAGLALIIFNLLTAFAPGSAFYSAMRNAALMEPDLYSVLPVVQGFVSIFSVIFIIPTLLACIGFWVFFAAAKNNHRPTASTGGLTLVQTTIIIRLIGVSLLLLLLGVLFIPICIAITEYASEFYESFYASSYYFSSSSYGFSSTMIIMVFVLIMIFLVLYIIYYAKALGTISSIKAASNGAFPAKPISMFVIVMNFIFAGFKIINLISTMISGFTFISFLTALFDIAFLILISIALLQLRRHLNMASSMIPASAAPMYNTQPTPVYQPYQPQQMQHPSYQPVQSQYTPQPQQMQQPYQPAAPQQTPQAQNSEADPEKSDLWQDPQ